MVQNLARATGYNAFAIHLAAGILYKYDILLSRAMGAVLMSLRTVIVAMNAKFLEVEKAHSKKVKNHFDKCTLFYYIITSQKRAFMANITIDEKRIEALIEKAVQKHLKLTMEDMDEVRRSPAAAIIRLEARVEAIEKTMATKEDIANLRNELGGRIGKLEAINKLIVAILLSMFGTIIAMLIKLFFLS